MAENENQNQNAEETETEEQLENAASELDEIEGSDELEAEKDRYLRLMADYENFRRRTEKEKLALFGDATAKCIEQLLPVVDNFERATEAKCSDEEYYKGMKMILEQLKGFLDKQGVTEIEALGSPFDPNIHQAIKREEATEEFPENTVCEVFQKGYMLKERLIRPAMVAVAN